jgi:hypothetical protein
MLLEKRPQWISPPLWRRIMLQHDAHKRARRQLARLVKSPRLALAFHAFRRAARQRDWARISELVGRVAAIAREVGDEKTIKQVIPLLRRVARFGESRELDRAYLSRLPKRLPNEWRGEDLGGKRVLVNLHHTDRQGLSVGYQRARLLGPVIDAAGSVTVLVEPRLVPTFRRSFPAIAVSGERAALDPASFDLVIFPDQMFAQFLPIGLDDAGSGDFLVADQELVGQLRARYTAKSTGGDRIVGICWHSSSHAKQYPSLADWAAFIRRHPATYVSLQYGNVENAVAILGPDRMIVDHSIDQLRDMDSFAAQVAALDGVITIVNTLAHVAGSLEVPTVVIRDDLLRREWPVTLDRTPWYPTVRIAGPDRRPWSVVLDEGWQKLEDLWAEARSRDGNRAIYR